MKWFLGLLFVFVLASGAQAALPVSLAAAPEVQSVLSNKCIHIETKGKADADFSDLLTVNRRSDLLDAVQREYAAMLPAGEKPEFEIKEISPGKYFYLNRKNQESHLTELMRELRPDGKIHAVYYVEGERFFGDFRALVHVEVDDAGAGKVSYNAEVYAWPQNSFCRNLARGLQFAIGSFFRSKTGEMTDIFLKVCSRLVEENRLAAAR
jgi:hypothetical protein